jgi:hypothetical protein
MNCSGKQQAARRMAPSEQGLDAGHAARREIDGRLKEQDELAVLECVTQIVLQIEVSKLRADSCRLGKTW